MDQVTIFALEMERQRLSKQFNREAWQGLPPASLSPRERLAAILFALAARLAPPLPSAPERPGVRCPSLEA